MFKLQPVKEWYFDTLPGFELPGFYKNLAHPIVLYQKLANCPTATVTVKPTQLPMQTKDLVVLPQWVFNTELYRELSPDPQYVMIGLLRGMLAYLALQKSNEKQKATVQARAYSGQVENIVHDVWLTAKTKARWLFFVELYYDFVYGTSFDKDVDLETPQGIVNASEGWRSKAVRSHELWLELELIVNELKNVTDYCTKEDRENIINRILDLLEEQVEQNQEDSQSSLTGESDSDNDQEPDNSDIDLDHEINQMNLQEKLEYLQEVGQAADQPLIEALLQNVEESLPDNTGDKAYTTIVEKTQADYAPVKVNSDFKKVGVLLDQKRAMAMPKELPTNQGQRINLQRLPRLMTDGKVFGSGKPKKVKKKKVFFLVADSSNSINQTVGYDKLIQALEGVRQSIQIGRNQAYVLAYTTKVVKEETHPYLEVLATPDGLPKINGYEDMKHSFTPESFILETLEKWIKGRIPPKYDPYIIILNDGEPYMREVETEIMVRRARKQVRRFRELGVKVLAFALTPKVYASDSDIYGANNTVKAYSGLLEQALTTVLQELP